ncbi:hypothetical protein CCAL12920_08230 [Campylobacter sp. RM12920]|uniref:XRE family transcriptional regulator n=1 Tax=Campylobacter californiensis TaxID=1032243 RepID=A0ABD4JKC4_9BACT|nr:hypothetical protein [Campylobacter sp. RM12919]MBE2988864.1 hypothetical protein [Campylobacter sp. RM12920]MBE3023031.1 hypothetical protein [Campylobacter sp. 7477a]
MTNIEFEARLNELNLSKKEFVEIVGMPYQTLMNWKQKDETPYWVEPFLYYYEKGKTLDELLAIIDKYKK